MAIRVAIIAKRGSNSVTGGKLKKCSPLDESQDPPLIINLPSILIWRFIAIFLIAFGDCDSQLIDLSYHYYSWGLQREATWLTSHITPTRSIHRIRST